MHTPLVFNLMRQVQGAYTGFGCLLGAHVGGVQVLSLPFACLKLTLVVGGRFLFVSLRFACSELEEKVP